MNRSYVKETFFASSIKQKVVEYCMRKIHTEIEDLN